MEAEDTQVALQSVRKLRGMAEMYASSQPDLAAFYMNEVSTLMMKMKLPLKSSGSYCPFCGALFRPNTSKSWVAPRMKTTKKIKKLLFKKSSVPLGKFKETLLNLYRNSENRLIQMCLKCEKKTSYRGAGRLVADKRKQEENVIRGTTVELSKRAKKRKKQKKAVGASVPSVGPGGIVGSSKQLSTKATAAPSGHIMEPGSSHIGNDKGKSKDREHVVDYKVPNPRMAKVESRKTRKAKKDLHNKLNKMLNTQKQVKSSSSSLSQFLSGL